MSTHHINSITARIPLPPQSLCLRDHIARIAVEDAAYYIQLYYRCTITVPQSLPLTTTNNFPFNPPQALCLRDHIARIAVEDEATLCEAMLMDADSVKEWAEAGSGEERGGGAPAFTGVATYRPQLGAAFIHVSAFQLAFLVTVVVV